MSEEQKPKYKLINPNLAIAAIEALSEFIVKEMKDVIISAITSIDSHKNKKNE